MNESQKQVEAPDFHKLIGWQVEEAHLVTGQGAPRFEMVLSHVVADHKLKVVVVPQINVENSAHSVDGVVTTTTKAMPAILVKIGKD